MIGLDVVTKRVGDVEFPELLQPVDDEPPATTILSVRREAGRLSVVGVSHDNGEISQVIVNGKSAELVRTTAGVVDWRVSLDSAVAVEAGAVDDAGNKELTGHRVEVVN